MSRDSFGLSTIPGSPSDAPLSLASSVLSLGMATPVSYATAISSCSSPPPFSAQLSRDSSQQQMVAPPVLMGAYVDEDDGPDGDDARSISTAGASSVATGSSQRTGSGGPERVQVGRLLVISDGGGIDLTIGTVDDGWLSFTRRLRVGLRPREATGRLPGGGVRLDVVSILQKDNDRPNV